MDGGGAGGEDDAEESGEGVSFFSSLEGSRGFTLWERRRGSVHGFLDCGLVLRIGAASGFGSLGRGGNGRGPGGVVEGVTRRIRSLIGWRAVGFAGLLGLACLGVWSLVGGRGVGESGMSAPLILERVRGMGDLRVVAHEYSEVSEHRSSRSAADWAQGLPLASVVVGAATENRALVRAKGTVEAGVDLRRALVREEGGRLVVFLPRATVYAPVVDAEVFDQKSGLLWRDDNLGLRARRAAGERFVAASERAGIRSEAERRAAAEVRRLLAPLSEREVVVMVGSGVEG